MFKLKNDNSSPLLSHGGNAINYLLPLILIFLLNILYYSIIRSDNFLILKANLIDLPLLAILIFFSHYLLENFFPGRRLIPILILILSLIILSLIKVSLFDLFNVPILINQDSSSFSRTFIVALSWYTVICVIISYTKLRSLKSEERILNSELEKRRYETEIELLKSQIQPHYFLNTLNNLYYLTLEKSDIAPEMVIKFSDLLKYLIYQSKNDKVPLLDELNVIQNFLDIEKLRYGNRLKIEFDLNGEINSKKITPLVLLPFIENSFKDSAEGKIGDIHIKIGLSINEKELYFSVENTNNYDQVENLHFQSGYNGLNSTKKRLDLLYKNSYDLNVVNTKEKRSIYLKIPVYNDKVPDYRR